jgi:UDP-galactopyranose mutase
MVKRFENLKLLGRTGAYWYNNSDHSMKMALDMARHLLKGTPMQAKEALFKV